MPNGFEISVKAISPTNLKNRESSLSKEIQHTPLRYPDIWTQCNSFIQCWGEVTFHWKITNLWWRLKGSTCFKVGVNVY